MLLPGAAGRLLEAADRGLSAELDQATLDGLTRTYLEQEGDREGE